ncbi:hypothetical protein CCHOA_09060 [Corynebacterium choanae]|uniref:Uncharacterized protein n=2 Tax=Corynebacterium choanae TaxID=1862358 RepID=A0A3G6J7W3_9CORY|nr:hypothetical protein CCHOA_09060 [Corynebacterium choanae]
MQHNQQPATAYAQQLALDEQLAAQCLTVLRDYAATLSSLAGAAPPTMTEVTGLFGAAHQEAMRDYQQVIDQCAAVVTDTVDYMDNFMATATQLDAHLAESFDRTAASQHEFIRQEW